MTPIARLSFSTSPPSAPGHPIHLPETIHSILGTLALLPQGGVSVNGFSVSVTYGTFVGFGFGLGTRGKEGGSLWWKGSFNSIPGIWTLELIGATPRETVAIQRILLFLPPLPPPTPFEDLEPPPPEIFPSRPRELPRDSKLPSTYSNTPHPEYRNSLLLLDEETNKVVAVLPLDPSNNSTPSTPPPVPPKPTSLRPKSTPLPQSISPGEALAAQVDQIIAHISPGVNLGAPGKPVDELTRRAQEQDSSEQAYESPAAPASGNVIMVIGSGEEEEKKTGVRESIWEDLEDDGTDRRTQSQLDAGFALLDAALEEAPSSLRAKKPFVESPSSTPTRLSTISLSPPEDIRPMSGSSFATSGTERFVTASESSFSKMGKKDGSVDSYQSAWTELGRTFTREVSGVGSLGGEEGVANVWDSTGAGNESPSEDEGTSTPTSPTTPTLPASLQAELVPLEPEPSEADNDRNGVLLRFLSGEPGSRFSVFATPVTREEIDQRGLVPVDGSRYWIQSWFGIESWSKWVKSWFSLEGWKRTKGDEPSSSPTSNPTDSTPILSSPSNQPSLFFPSYSPYPGEGKTRPIKRRANGEPTSRLSVVYFDDEGYGKRAYMDGAGGRFGGMSPGGLGRRY